MTDREYFTQTTCGEGLSKEAEAYISKIAPNYAKNMSAAIVEAIGGNGKRLNILRSLRLTKAPHLDGLNRVDAEIPSGAFKIRARLYIPNSRSEARIPALLYLHGGGWTIGAIESCELFCQKFALEAECAVCAIDYRLAPEHKHPAAEEDSLAAFEWILENAERFGLSQLHQLRGRVGRGKEKSYCILMSPVSSKKKSESNFTKRLDVLCKNNSGFTVAEKDLELRGPGEFFGVRQSGEMSFRIADIAADMQLVYMAKAEAENACRKGTNANAEYAL